jgi:adenylate cyclase
VHLNEIFSRFDDLVERHGVEKIKTVGDAYMAVGGLPLPQPDHADCVVALGLAMIEATAGYAEEWHPALAPGRDPSGPVAGVIGKQKLSYDLWGDTVNVASRMDSQGMPGAAQISDATWRLLGRAVAGTCRGEIELKGRGTMPARIARLATEQLRAVDAGRPRDDDQEGRS